jgi:hypothetical protein
MKVFWNGSARKRLVLIVCLMACAGIALQAQTITLRTTTEYIRNGSTVARGILEYPPGEFQFFTMMPYPGAAKPADDKAPPITVAFMVRTFRGKDPTKGSEESVGFGPDLIIRVYLADKQQLKVLSKVANLFYAVADVIGGKVSDSYLDKFKWKLTNVQGNKDTVGFVELSISAWPSGDPCFGF